MEPGDLGQWNSCSTVHLLHLTALYVSEAYMQKEKVSEEVGDCRAACRYVTDHATVLQIHEVTSLGAGEVQGSFLGGSTRSPPLGLSTTWEHLISCYSYWVSPKSNSQPSVKNGHSTVSQWTAWAQGREDSWGPLYGSPILWLASSGCSFTLPDPWFPHL